MEEIRLIDWRPMPQKSADYDKVLKESFEYMRRTLAKLDVPSTYTSGMLV